MQKLRLVFPEMMRSRLKLFASFAGRVASMPPKKLQPQCVRGMHSHAWSATPHRRAMVFLASGIVSFAAYGSFRNSQDAPEIEPAAPSPPPISTTLDQANLALFHPTPARGYLERCRHAMIMAVRCAVVSVVLWPAAVLFILNRVSNGYIVRELSVARVLASSLQLLGPAAIKFGQWASSRDDLFPPVVTAELGRLQSNIEPHSLEHTLIETDKMLKAYQSLNPNNAAVTLEDIHPVPIGSGSIAQVNTMKPHHKCVTLLRRSTEQHLSASRPMLPFTSWSKFCIRPSGSICYLTRRFI
jgi:hypothetical protein